VENGKIGPVSVQFTSVPDNPFTYQPGFLLSFFFTFFGFAGLDFPKDPRKIFPFFVFLSPLPIIIFFDEKEFYDQQKSSGTNKKSIGAF
jgi:hypothetical protein